MQGPRRFRTHWRRRRELVVESVISLQDPHQKYSGSFLPLPLTFVWIWTSRSNVPLPSITLTSPASSANTHSISASLSPFAEAKSETEALHATANPATPTAFRSEKGNSVRKTQSWKKYWESWLKSREKFFQIGCLCWGCDAHFEKERVWG